MSSNGPTTRTRVEVLDGDKVSRREDALATEEPMELRLAWPGRRAEPLAVTMRTPGSDFELAAGFCHAEGLVGLDGLDTVAYCTDAVLTLEQRYNTVTVTLAGPPPRDPAPRYGVTSAACGVCGQQSLDELAERDYPPVDESLTVDVDLVRRLPDLLREAQPAFSRTGGLHAAGLFDAAGTAAVVREDIGRHNAVDKAVGWTLLNGRSRAGLALVVSGRAGYEIVQKAVAAGVGLVVAVGAPSSLAVDLARRFEVTVAGFVRGERCVVYNRPDRIVH
ncbi:MAG TPA: formate dehydrogenase accessory sulfurtransferase FdhD [Kribbellaceae bacterium]|nr:formate dehydrogenase accessory sulfurtransferase FdhD [Kribbellaceae bacterium]